MDRLVEALLINLSRRVNRSGLHSMDEDQVVAGFKALRKYGIPFDSDEVEDWASSNGWQELAVKYLNKVAVDTNSGINKRIKHGAKLPTRSFLEGKADEYGL